MTDVSAGGLTCNGKTGSNAGHRAGGLADNKKTRHYEKRVSGTAVSQLSFLQIINIFRCFMTLYDLLKQISNIITPEDDSFYRYAIYTSDDNGGFLRTRYCWWLDKPIKNHELGEGYECVLVTSKREINIKDFCDETDTRVKMQISYSLINASVEDADWDAQLGYCYAYLFELNKHSFKVIHMRKYL